MTDQAPGLTQVFRSTEFRALWGAELVSVLGDQLARVALAVLVYGRTSSAALAAATYALTFLPALVGGVALGGIADRIPRRTVMIVVDLLRAALLTAMAMPGIPLWVLCGLLVVAVMLGPLHKAAQGALLPDVLPGNLYERGLAIRQMTDQSAQLAGFAASGGILVLVSPSTALLLDACTFGVSALLVAIGVRHRAAVAARRDDRSSTTLNRVRLVLAGRQRGIPITYAWLIGFYVVPEGLAAPYAASQGGGPAAVAALMASIPAGGVAGAWIFTRFVADERRPRLVGPLAVAAGIPLLACPLAPGLPASIALWALSGACSTAYLLQTQASFVRATPTELRGQALGVAAAGIVASQGVALLIAAPVAEALGAATTVAASGAAGAVAAGAAAMAWWLWPVRHPSPV